MDAIPENKQFARWDWEVEDGMTVGYLETILPKRNLHPLTKIKAFVSPQEGEWWVEENNVLVAGGVLRKSDPLWRDGNGAQLEAERVICFGATSLDNARAKLIYHDD